MGKLSLPNSIHTPDRITIDLVGCGATGSNVLVGLGRLSEVYRQLHKRPFQINVFDPDNVEHHNVCNQRFYSSDVGHNKAKVLASRVNRAFDLDINAHAEHYKEPRSMFVVSCVDNWITREYIREHIKKSPKRSGGRIQDTKFWIDVGNGPHYGQVILGTFYGNNPQPNVIDLHKNSKREEELSSCSAFDGLYKQHYGINQIMAWGAEQMLANILLYKSLSYSQMYINLENLNITTNEL